MKPIEHLRSQINVVTGTSLIAENGHALSNAMWLNGTKPAHGTEIRGGTTIDQMIAEEDRPGHHLSVARNRHRGSRL